MRLLSSDRACVFVCWIARAMSHTWGNTSLARQLRRGSAERATARAPPRDPPTNFVAHASAVYLSPTRSFASRATSYQPIGAERSLVREQSRTQPLHECGALRTPRISIFSSFIVNSLNLNLSEFFKKRFFPLSRIFHSIYPTFCLLRPKSVFFFFFFNLVTHQLDATLDRISKDHVFCSFPLSLSLSAALTKFQRRQKPPR